MSNESVKTGNMKGGMSFAKVLLWIGLVIGVVLAILRRQDYNLPRPSQSLMVFLVGTAYAGGCALTGGLVGFVLDALVSIRRRKAKK